MRYMGQAGFLILLSSVMSPPEGPFLRVFERETLIMTFVSITYAWTCLAMKLADLARVRKDPIVSVSQAVTTGEYIEAAPTVIIAIFIFIGTVVILHVRARKGPGPYLFACIFSCMCMDISLTTAVFIPFPYYRLGLNIVIPLGFHSVIALLCSIFIFPQTVSAEFTSRLQDVLTPLATSVDLHRKILKIPSDSPEFARTVGELRGVVNKSEAAVVPLAITARLLPSDLIYSRFQPMDFKPLHNLIKRMAVRANGMTIYFGLIDPTRERFPITPVTSRPNTPGANTPNTARSRAPSVDPVERAEMVERIERPERVDRAEGSSERVERSEKCEMTEKTDKQEGSQRPSSSRAVSMDRGLPTLKVNTALTERDDAWSTYSHLTPVTTNSPSIGLRRSHYRTHHSSYSQHAHTPTNHSHYHTPHSHHHHPHFQHHHHHHHHHRLLHNALAHLSHISLPRHHKRDDHAVGVFESQRYMDLEAKVFHDPLSEMYTERTKELLTESCDALLEGCKEMIVNMQDWLMNCRKGRWNFWQKKTSKEDMWQKRVEELEKLRARMERLLREFKEEKRHSVLEPYRSAFEKVEGDDDDDLPSHRYLFNCYVYQYHLMRFATQLTEMHDIIIRLEHERRVNRIWTPVQRLFHWGGWELDDHGVRHDDEDPDMIQGITPVIEDDLGMPRKRDPDALPPRNTLESIARKVYKLVVSLASGNTLYALKAAFLTTLLCLPYFLRESAPFAYKNRFVWAIIMAQLTIARFRGDTTFGQITRILCTFLGGIVGMLIWYIASGNGNGSPYGFAATLAVCFPFLLFARLYWPGPPMQILIFLMTTMLVIGYSYQDGIIVLPSNPGVGWDVAWRRFVLVSSGVTAAFIFSFFPPAFTIRKYQRTTLATTCSEIGILYCAILSYANSRNDDESQEIVTSLVAIRSKLNRSAAIKANVKYEFSLRGRWPEHRYQRMLSLQMELAYSLSHLLSIVEHLEPAWTQAFLGRTRFMDPNFQGDMLAVISMISTALRTGTPLPQITPCPLLDRFLLKYHGLNVIHREAEEDYGLPRNLTKETLENDQYMMFCVGVSTAFGIVSRLDKLMMAAKEIVGEQYHIHGVGMMPSLRGVGVPLGPRTSTITFRPPNDV
ncbi:hypothetical protein K435DRAFT_720372 [Dendrothele bispora CBS 962.96]|uniref:DUF2421 domain-containing protein n=1 Tax=Dendrothele bispora (strain CBS 962.96) TaxID=1314807 RepID=A0A4S8M8S0_DENBC|nr:hypothetical protein K435DRAFT_720372 [Dendrothele bispora CBS 962.96]